jgi:hypothetical protein
MNDKFLLPKKFDLPGQKHWTSRALWCAAGVLGVQVVLFAAVLWRHQSAQATALSSVQVAQPVQATTLAAAPAAAAPAVAAAPVAASAPVAVATQEKPVATKAQPTRKKAASRRSSSRSSKVLASRSSTGARKGSKDGDSLDALLKRFR